MSVRERSPDTASPRRRFRHANRRPIVTGRLVAIVSAVTLGVLVVLVLGGALGPGGGVSEEGSPGAFDGGASVGAPVRVGNVTYRVLSVRDIPDGELARPAAGNRILAVEMEAVNEGGEPAHVSSFDWSLRDGKGRQYDEVAVEAPGLWRDGDVPPDGRLRGEVLYEVPVAVTELELVIKAVFGETVSISLT